MDWSVVDTGLETAVKIMQKDQDLLERIHLEKGPILHFYEWKDPSVTYGHFIDPQKFFCLKSVSKEGLSLARRPTGGGIIFHLWDFAFSALVPSHSPFFSQNTLENYALINLAVRDALQEFLQIQEGLVLTPQDGDLLGKGCEHFCMAKPTRYDVMLQGKKVAGAAQRKTRNGFLHQGSISLRMPSSALLQKVLLPEVSVVEAMNTWTYPLLGKEELDLAKVRLQIKDLIYKYLHKRFEI